MGISLTRKKVKTSGIMIDRIVAGKIVEEWEEWDTLGMMQQLGAVSLNGKTGDTPAARQVPVSLSRKTKVLVREDSHAES